MIFIERSEEMDSETMRDVADDANVPFNPQSIIYIPGGSGWIGFKDAPDLPDPAKNNLESVFEDKLGHSVEFATGETQDKIHEWVEATPPERDELEKQGYPP